MKRKKKKQKPNKAKIMCVVMTVSFAVICLFLGVWQTGIYTERKSACTHEIIGVVTGKPPDYSRQWRIKIQSDEKSSPFKNQQLCAAIRGGDEGDKVIIHYSPEHHENYYITDIEDVRLLGVSENVNYPKISGIFAYATSGFMLALSLFLAMLTHRSMQPKSKRK